MLLYALGRYTFAFHWLYDYLPGVAMFRRPADATYALGAIAAIASGYLLHVFLSGNQAPSKAQGFAVLGTVAVVLLTALGAATAHGHFNTAIEPVLLSAAMFAAGWALLLALSYVPPQYTSHVIAGLAAFMTVDLALANGPNRSTAKAPAQYEELRADTKNETVAFLKEHLGQSASLDRRDRVELVGLGFEWPNIGLVHNFDHVLGYNPVRLGEIVQAIGANETIAESWQRVFTPLFPSYRSTMADLMGLRYIVIGRPIESFDRKLHFGDMKLLGHTQDGYIYENPRALPRVMFVSGWKFANFDKLVADGRWPDFDPTQTILLNGTPAETPPVQALHVALTNPSIELKDYQNTEVQIEVDSPEAGFVVLNDIWHPWWFGTIDGKPAEILRANVLFRAIQVPAGRHTAAIRIQACGRRHRRDRCTPRRQAAASTGPGNAWRAA